jgi:hypothetical protein
VLPREGGAIVLLSLVVGLGLFRPWVHGIDGTGYYSWLRSAVIDGDLETADEFQHFDRLERDWSDPFRAAPTGLHANPYPIGPAVLWSPAFLLAHWAAPSLGYPADGYSPPYIWAISLTSVTLVVVALLLLLDLARRWAAPGPAMWGVVAVWLSSPLVFYQYAHPSMSHAADVFMNSLVVWWWVCSTARFGRLRACFVLGLLIGGAALVRPQNMLLLLLPGAWLLARALRHRPAPRGWGAPLAGVCALGIGALLLFMPQLWVWWRVFGSPFVNVQAIAYRAPLHVDLLRPHLLEVLFSSNRGLFTWSPILAPATLAWPLLWRRDRPGAALLLVNAIVQFYLIASWPTWWGGAAFGARLLLGVFPFWALSLAAGFEWLRRRGHSVFAMAGVATVFALWNALLLAQYALGLVARNGPTDLGAMARNQWTVIARLLARLPLH